MKHLLLLFSLLVIGLNNPVIAQQETSETEVVQTTDDDSKSGLRASISFDDEISNDEKIKKVTDLVGKFDTELADELKVELEGLDEEEKRELGRAFEEGFHFDGGDDIPAGAMVVAVVAVVLIFGMPLFLLIALLAYGHVKRRQKMELVNLYINSDKELPEHVMAGFDGAGSSSSLKSGLVLTAVGFGIVAAFSIMGAEEVSGLGLIPMFLGIARLIFWYLEERKKESNS